MSRSGDDYAPTNRNPTTPVDTNGSEPADPDTIDYSDRRDLCLAPDTVKTAKLPAPFVQDGDAVTIVEARETYRQVQRHNWNSEKYTSAYERHRYGLYPRILEADRHFQSQYPGLTTAMITRRLSPISETDGWLTPWECNEMLHGGAVHRSVRDTLTYQLDNFEYEWVAVTAPTRSAGTPHEHIYLWIDDPDNKVSVDHLGPGLDKHLKYCANAYEKHHRSRTDGTGGAITMSHEPPVIDSIPEKFFDIPDQSQTYAEIGEVWPNTTGAQYLASQLAHLPLGDYYNSEKPDPPEPLFEGAALAWASHRNWFRASRGVPS